MLPPIDDTVLRANPDFCKIYKTLTTVKLNPDGTSTLDARQQKERDAVRTELDKHRLSYAKQFLLISALETLVPEVPSHHHGRKIASSSSSLARPGTISSSVRQPSSSSFSTTASHSHKPSPSLSLSNSAPAPLSTDIPAELLEFILLLPVLLSPSSASTISSSDLSLLLSVSPLSNLPLHIRTLSPHLGASLRNSAAHLARIASPTTNPSYLHRVVPTLPEIAASHHASLERLRQSLRDERLAALRRIVSLLATHAGVLALLARSLDAKHTLVARHLELSSHVVALEAQREDVAAQNVRAKAQETVYAPEAVRALQAYAHHLHDAKTRAEEGVRALTTELAAYGACVEGIEVGGGDSSKEKKMREVARVYKDMGKQIEEVRTDLERLKQS